MEPDELCALPAEYSPHSERVLRDPLRDFWFRAAVLVDGSISRTKVFSPGSSITIGAEPVSDFCVPGISGPLHVLRDGTRLHLTTESSVRMSGPSGQRYTVARWRPEQEVVVATEVKVHFLVRPGVSLYVFYGRTEEALQPDE